MPSVTDIQQQISKISSNNNGKSTPPPTQQQINSTSSNTTNDPANADPVIQAILMLEKKQRNLGKRKEKLESYDQEAKSGKELNKDQKDALSKYAEVLGQIECVKDIYEQMKKIQTEAAKNQKRLAKQAAEEKRLLAAQRLREYAQLRYLLDHRPSSLKSEESSLLDELARVVIPSDLSLNTITRSADTVLAIYQGGSSSSTIKNLLGRTSQEVRELVEQLNQQSSQTNDTSTPQQTQLIETVKQTPLVPQVPPPTPASVLPQREQQQQQQQQPQSQSNNNDVMIPSLSHTHLVQTNPNEYPLQFDTRNQNIPLQQIMQDNTFFPVDLNNANVVNQQDSSNNQDNQSNDQKQFNQTYTGHNSNNVTGQVPPQGYTQTQSASSQQQQGVNNYDQENLSNVEQQSEEQWQQPRSNSGNANRGAHYNGSANRNSYRGGGSQNNYNQPNWRGPRGGGNHYDSSYGSGQRQYNENNNRGGGSQRGAPNPNYRGNRGGGYRGGNRGGNGGYSGNGYQKPHQYQQSNEHQQQQVHSTTSN